MLNDNSSMAEFNEARIMLRLAHPHVVRFYGYAVRPPSQPELQNPCTVSEFCAEVHLSRYCEKTELNRQYTAGLQIATLCTTFTRVRIRSCTLI